MTASTLAHKEWENTYERNIAAAAFALSVAGLGDAEYVTQYSSGSTLWRVAGTTRIIKTADMPSQAWKWAGEIKAAQESAENS